MTTPVDTGRNWLEKVEGDYFHRNGEVYLPLTESDFELVMPLLAEKEVSLIALFAVQDFSPAAPFTLFYVLEKRGCPGLVALQRDLDEPQTTSIAHLFPAATWYEREVRDGFGIAFQGAFDSRRLFLHEAYPASFHPLLKSFHNRTLIDRTTGPAPEPYLFKEVEGEGVYNVLVGPVHAGIIEPGHFHFSVVGETIANLEVRLFYKHRGLEKLAEGLTPEAALKVAETVSGDESAANAAAFCLAVEKIAGVQLSRRTGCLRTILLEMERIYSHLGDLAGMIVDVAFSLGAAEFTILREEILRYNEIFSGSRFLKGILCPGGLSRDIPTKALYMLNDYLELFETRFERAVRYVRSLDSVLDRLETTGVIQPGLVRPLNLSGPAARASGAAVDTRRDHPYGLYGEFQPALRIAAGGDVLSRFDVKCAEVSDSVALIRRLIDGVNQISHQPVRIEYQLRDGCALSLVEAARGQNLHWLYLKNGRVERYKVRTASFCDWQAIEHAVIGNIVPDFPLINKSLNLSYAGTDL